MLFFTIRVLNRLTIVDWLLKSRSPTWRRLWPSSALGTNLNQKLVVKNVAFDWAIFLTFNFDSLELIVPAGRSIPVFVLWQFSCRLKMASECLVLDRYLPSFAGMAGGSSALYQMFNTTLEMRRVRVFRLWHVERWMRRCDYLRR